jgi:hypothetical protein
MTKKGGHWGDKGTKGDYIIYLFIITHMLNTCRTIIIGTFVLRKTRKSFY